MNIVTKSSLEYFWSKIKSALDKKINTSGGTVTGALVHAPNVIADTYREQDSYQTSSFYGTSGNEALSFVAKNSVTSFMFVHGSDVKQWNSGTWNSITPTLQTKNKSVYVNKLITNGTTPAYNFYVEGTANINGTLTQKGVAVATTDNTYTKQEVDQKIASSSGVTWDILYPIGAVYISTSNVSPKTFLGGTWVKINNDNTTLVFARKTNAFWSNELFWGVNSGIEIYAWRRTA